MPFEHFKTQVLLLHSEQAALDKMSAGFSDRYTVHCATSGYEALNTLGETPIHVIVSANSLPGMSGAEALREAKKRSPETIGILLTDDDDKQAFVGDKEIFQVVRGDIDPKNISKLIDAATQQIRLMALADSANDNAAQPEEGTGEHIVMETDDFGSTIVSDGTGTHAVLDPSKLAETSPVGAQAVGILVMTKDDDFLKSVKECCRGMHTVHQATSIKQAQELLRSGQAGVGIIDAGMIGPNVEKLTQHLQSIERRLVTIVAGRREDGEMLMDLINRGKVYRFLLKPVSPGRVRLAVDASVKHHLDSPDSAFQKVAPVPEPAAKPEPAKSKGPVRPAAKEAQKAQAAPKEAPSVVNERLADAFDDDESRFAETVNTIVSKFRKGETQDEAPPKAEADSGGDSPFNLPLMGGIAVVVIAVAVAGLWLLSGEDAPEAVTEPVAESTPAETETDGPAAITETRPEPVAETSAAQPAPQQEEPAAAATSADRESLDALLAAAQAAEADGRLFSPVNDNALELYSEALLLAPSDPEVRAAFDQSVSQSISAIEAALLEERIAVVEVGVRQVGLVRPDHPRLPFLIAQANQAKIRTTLDEARQAIADGRFEEAAAAIASAAELDADEGQISGLERELADARSSQETQQVLRVAARRLEQGRLTSPANDNARYLYDLVLRNDPSNAAARQGLAAVAAKLVLNARVEMDAGRLDEAETMLNQAAAIDARSPELSAARDALAGIREQQAQAEQEALAAEREARAAAAAAAEEASRPVPVSSLSRVKYVAPKYPRAAERRGISGWVDVIFTVSSDGTVQDIEVLDSKPSDIFVSSAIAAVERWEFEPVRENGEIVEKRAGVRLMFALE